MVLRERTHLVEVDPRNFGSGEWRDRRRWRVELLELREVEQQIRGAGLDRVVRHAVSDLDLAERGTQRVLAQWTDERLELLHRRVVDAVRDPTAA